MIFRPFNTATTAKTTRNLNAGRVADGAKPASIQHTHFDKNGNAIKLGR